MIDILSGTFARPLFLIFLEEVRKCLKHQISLRKCSFHYFPCVQEERFPFVTGQILLTFFSHQNKIVKW